MVGRFTRYVTGQVKDDDDSGRSVDENHKSYCPLNQVPKGGFVYGLIYYETENIFITNVIM